MSLARPRVLFLWALAACTCSSSSAIADPAKWPNISEKAVCVDAHAWGQQMRNENRLLEAAQAFEVCARSRCPNVLRGECERWGQEVSNEIPSLVVSVRDEAGRPIRDAFVLVDGKVVSTSIDGRPIRMDPGERLVRVKSGEAFVERGLLVRPGERKRAVQLTLALPSQPQPAPAAAVDASPSEHPREDAESSGDWRRPVGWGLIAAGAAGLTSAVVFSVRAKNDENDLLDTCAPNCSEDNVDDMRRLYTISDVSLGVGLLAGAVGTYLLLTAPADEPTSRGWVGVDVAGSGTFLSAGGTF